MIDIFDCFQQFAFGRVKLRRVGRQRAHAYFLFGVGCVELALDPIQLRKLALAAKCRRELAIERGYVRSNLRAGSTVEDQRSPCRTQGKRKRGVEGKRKHAAWNNDYLLWVLEAGARLAVQ